ncbi:hypothetical protein BCON_0231g00060 [Botryotinia convoluta]|uniref:Uncharacterized protein n=1 Tax=Botryotinia convoluta TaxID=54673 RepID=A0A4Z1HIG2_9HELO|nr:hypothetical protein BCON_0231g00060 [Botryotinia convoluta]
MEIHRKFTDKVKTHPKYFQIFLVVLVVTFVTIILIAGVLKTPLLELHAPDDDGLAHLAHGLFGIKVHLNYLHHPKIENAMAFISFFTLLAAAMACPWILLDYRCQIQFISNDDITVKVGTSIIGLGFTAVLFSLVSREILIVGTLKNERAIQTFSGNPRNGEDSRRYSLDDEDLRRSSFNNEEAERSQIPVQTIRQEPSMLVRGYQRSVPVSTPPE